MYKQGSSLVKFLSPTQSTSGAAEQDTVRDERRRGGLSPSTVPFVLQPAMESVFPTLSGVEHSNLGKLRELTAVTGRLVTLSREEDLGLYFQDSASEE